MLGQTFIVALLSLLPAAPPESADRAPHVVRRDVHEALRRQATTSGGRQDAATRDVVALYHEIYASRQFSELAQRQLLGQLRSRLRRTRDTLVTERRTEGVGRVVDVLSGVDSRGNSPANQAILAQNAGNLGVQNRPPAAAIGNIRGQQVPGPVVGFDAATAQNADELIELIETTIAPKSWQVNGGLGTIMYFSPEQVLVIRQTDGVHTQVGAALQDLRGPQP